MLAHAYRKMNNLSIEFHGILQSKITLEFFRMRFLNRNLSVWIHDKNEYSLILEFTDESLKVYLLLITRLLAYRVSHLSRGILDWIMIRQCKTYFQQCMTHPQIEQHQKKCIMKSKRTRREPDMPETSAAAAQRALMLGATLRSSSLIGDLTIWLDKTSSKQQDALNPKLVEAFFRVRRPSV